MERGEYALMDAAEDRMWWYRALHTRLCDALRGTRGSILDAGCGTGGFLAILRARRPDLARLALSGTRLPPLAPGVNPAPGSQGAASTLFPLRTTASMPSFPPTFCVTPQWTCQLPLSNSNACCGLAEFWW